MTPISYLEVFKALNSEVMLAVTALAALTLDLASLRRAEPLKIGRASCRERV